jgi:hypothetical protein
MGRKRHVAGLVFTAVSRERSVSMFRVERSKNNLRVFMCFVWISEQTAIISPYSFNWLVRSSYEVKNSRIVWRHVVHGDT